MGLVGYEEPDGVNFNVVGIKPGKLLRWGRWWAQAEAKTGFELPTQEYQTVSRRQAKRAPGSGAFPPMPHSTAFVPRTPPVRMIGSRFQLAARYF